MVIDGINIQIDTNGNFFGFGFVSNGRTYSEGGFTSLRKAQIAARSAVRRAKAAAARKESSRLDYLRVTIRGAGWSER